MYRCCLRKGGRIHLRLQCRKLTSLQACNTDTPLECRECRERDYWLAKLQRFLLSIYIYISWHELFNRNKLSTKLYQSADRIWQVVVQGMSHTCQCNTGCSKYLSSGVKGFKGPCSMAAIRFYSPVSVLLIMVLNSQNLEVALSVHAQCHEKPQSDCSSLGLKTPNHWIQLATLMAVASQNCCTWNSCLASFHHSGWSLGVWKVSYLFRVVENKTAEKKDSLSSEWKNIDLWYDRKSNSMVSSQKWPPQFVSQYICHISGPSQAGPLQSTELRPPGP